MYGAISCPESNFGGFRVFLPHQSTPLMGQQAYNPLWRPYRPLGNHPRAKNPSTGDVTPRSPSGGPNVRCHIVPRIKFRWIPSVPTPPEYPPDGSAGIQPIVEALQTTWESPQSQKSFHRRCNPPFPLWGPKCTVPYRAQNQISVDSECSYIPHHDGVSRVSSEKGLLKTRRLMRTLVIQKKILFKTSHHRRT